MTVYLDTSVVVAILIDEPSSEIARAWFRRLADDDVIVADLAAVEFAAGISRWLRMGRIDVGQAEFALASFDMLRAQCLSYAHGRDDFALAELIARDFATKLLAPDALHLASAKNAGATLATFDARLADAARMQGIEVAALG
ncbi:MAG: type II toxin-antitoxin system VapC family toxin [Roseiarcus sp.]